jgi:SNF2 family DNA or RNA helicase
MIVLHGGILDGRLAIWGEVSEKVPAAKARSGTAKSFPKGLKGAAPLPRGADDTEITDALRTTAAIPIQANGRRFVNADIQLPTVGREPIASSPLIDEPPLTKSEPKPAAWSIRALPLSWEETAELLCACVGKDVLVPGVVIGKDLAFWTSVLRLAGSIVTQEQFVPTVAPAESGPSARWKPLLSADDSGRLATLAKAMPAVARALSRDGHQSVITPAAAVLSGFIDELVDHLVRGNGSAAASLDQGESGLSLRRRRKSTRRGEAFDSVHDQWLHALGTSDVRLSAQSAELQRLESDAREWLRPIHRSESDPFRLCFRLEEPTGGQWKSITEAVTSDANESWFLAYLLQGRNDPSLLIPAEKVWRNGLSKVALMRDKSFQPKEFLLRSLGQASGICPRIEASLKQSTPEGCVLDATGAHEFLTERAPALEQAGFGVLLPAWWTRKGTKLRLTARAHARSPKLQGGSALSLSSVVQFDWRLAVGDEPLSQAELEALARLKAPLVNVRGQWVEMRAEEIEAALEFWRRKGTETATVRDVIHSALGGGVDGLPIEFGGVVAEGWIDQLLAQLDGREPFEELPPPAEFQGTLRPYQVRGYSWLVFLRRWGLGACLADDMGLGKTIQTLAMIQREWHGGEKRPVLLVCPMSVMGNWKKEAERFTPELPVLVHHGVTRVRGESFRKDAERQALVITSYAILLRDAEHLGKVPWAGIVLDEAQNVKNAETKQAQTARSIPSDYRIALTGTPVENNVGDLWSIMEFLNPGFLGTQAAFRRTFFLPIQAYRDPAATDRLKRITGPFVLRRLKTDKAIIADLPEKLEMKVFCTLTKEQASLYQAVVKEAERGIETAEGIQRRGIILATLSKLKQVCNHPAHFLGDNSAVPGRSGKLARLSEMIEEVLSVKDRALIFTQFTEMGQILRRHLQETFGREVLFLHGAVPKGQRDRMVERFQSDGSDAPPVFILSVKAGGTGLNLTRGNHVFHFDRWWNPAVENQATDRAFRIGQTRRVQVHKFVCVGTVEERIDEMIELKKEVADKVVGTGESWLTELSTAELKNLFALRKEAVAQ